MKHEREAGSRGRVWSCSGMVEDFTVTFIIKIFFFFSLNRSVLFSLHG